MRFLNWFHLHFNNTLACNKLARFSKFHNTQHTNHPSFLSLLPPPLMQPLTELNYKALLMFCIGVCFISCYIFSHYISLWFIYDSAMHIKSTLLRSSHCNDRSGSPGKVQRDDSEMNHFWQTSFSSVKRVLEMRFKAEAGQMAAFASDLTPGSFAEGDVDNRQRKWS